MSKLLTILFLGAATLSAPVVAGERQTPEMKLQKLLDGRVAGKPVDCLSLSSTNSSQIIEGKGATNYAIGLSTARILEALLKDEGRVLPVSSLLTNYRGISDVCLSVPCIINAKGVDEPLEVPMNEAEVSGLTASAERIRAAIRAVGF